MIKYVSVEEMVAIEKEADASGLTYPLMMEHAGNGLADAVHIAYASLKDGGALGLVGSGNNGGDTLVALARLAHLGWRTAAYLVRPRPQDDPLIARLSQAGGELIDGRDDHDLARLEQLLAEYPVVLDGVLGTGARLPLKPELAQVLDFVRQRVTQQSASGALLRARHVVAVDCPSGVDCDSGQAAPECIPAELTVTMAAIKRGLLAFPAYNLVGRLQVVGIGLGESHPMPKAWEAVRRFVPQADWVAGVLPPRPLDAHKGTFGTALIVAGSLNYTGAALLAGKAAYRIGAGLVTMAVPQPLHEPLAGHFPEATWILLPDETGVIAAHADAVLRANLGRATALLLGPGFGLEDCTRLFLANLLSGDRSAPRGKIGFTLPEHGSSSPPPLPPLVIDADGLKLLARLPDWPQRLPAPAVLTPHPGEMSVLTGLSTQEIQADRVAIAERFAAQWGHVVVLKGAFTVIAAPQGDTAVIPVASPSLARAGSGDVLAGLIVGLRAQGVEAFPAAVAAAWVHAQAGLHAAEKLGLSASVLAGDILASVPDVLRQVLSSA